MKNRLLFAKYKDPSRAFIPFLLAILNPFCMAGIALAQTAAPEPTQYSARTIALGLADIADTRDEWSPNPALLSDTSSHIRAVLSPLPNGPSDSWSAGFTGDYPLSNGAIAGASFSEFQSSNFFSFESFGLQASKTFDLGNKSDSSYRKAVAGFRFRYCQETYSPMYLPFQDYTADFGAQFDIAAQLTLGAAVTHLFGIKNQDLNIESRTAWLGLTYRPVPEASANVVIESSEDSHPDYHFGVEYALDENVLVRVGAEILSGETVTGIISGGIGVRTDILTIDFAASRHPDLGTSISFGIGLAL